MENTKQYIFLKKRDYKVIIEYDSKTTMFLITKWFFPSNFEDIRPSLSVDCFDDRYLLKLKFQKDNLNKVWPMGIVRVYFDESKKIKKLEQKNSLILNINNNINNTIIPDFNYRELIFEFSESYEEIVLLFELAD